MPLFLQTTGRARKACVMIDGSYIPEKRKRDGDQEDGGWKE